MIRFLFSLGLCIQGIGEGLPGQQQIVDIMTIRSQYRKRQRYPSNGSQKSKGLSAGQYQVFEGMEKWLAHSFTIAMTGDGVFEANSFMKGKSNGT